MRNPISKAIVAAIAALTMSAAVVSSTAPASAGMRMGGGFGGGFHGGGFGGGFHPGVGGGFRPGFNRSFVFVNRGRFFRRGFFGPAFVGGVAVGSAWGWGWGWDSGCWTYRPFYDGAGRYLGDGYVNICS